jgi:hypothetical protein
VRGGKPYLGIRLAAAPEGVRVLLNLGEKGGLIVRSVEPDGPGDRAGVQAEDVILSFAGQRVGQLAELKQILGDHRGGQTVTIELLRQGRRRRVELTLGRRGSGSSGAVPRETTPRVAASPRRRVRRFLHGLGARALERIDGLMERAEGADERAEMLRLAVRSLAKKLGEAGEAELEELRKAVRRGLAKYLGKYLASSPTARSRAEALERLLDRMLNEGVPAPGAKRKRDIRKLLDVILGEGGKKKPARADRPTPATPEIDPEMLRAELDRLRARIERDGFPQTLKGVRALVETLLKSMKTDRKRVRGLIEMMGGPDGAKALVKQQLEDNGIPLTDADMDRVLKVLMEDDDAGAGSSAKKTARRAYGKLGFSVDWVSEGAKVIRIDAGTAAAKCRLRVGDLVLRFGNARCTSGNAIRGQLKGKYAGDVIELKIRRDGIERTLKLKLLAK